MMEDSKIHAVTLTTLTYGGEAMGRLEDGRAVFIPFGLPGERVSVRLTDEKKNFARGEIVEILSPSPDRIEPKCKHFGECGGCHYQNLSYEKQLTAKTEILIGSIPTRLSHSWKGADTNSGPLTERMYAGVPRCRSKG